jgi:hypothetical protein
MSAGGGGSDVISSSDMQAVLSSCKALPITWCHFLAYYQLGGHEQAKLQFKKYLNDYIYDELIIKDTSLCPKMLKRHHGSIIQSHLNITNCVLSYLTRNKVEGDLIRHHFPQVKRKTYERNYSKFMRKIIGNLEEKLYYFECQISARVKENVKKFAFDQ